jgi:uncharacterized protein (TIGR02268 family)
MVLLLLLTGTVAGAQPQLVHGRNVTISGHPAEPTPMARVASGFTTLILLDAPIDRASVHWDRDGFTHVDVGDRSIVLAPAAKLEPGQQWRLRARYLDGAQPQWLGLGVVVDPASVDTQLTVARLRRPGTDCLEVRTEPCAPCPRLGAAASLWEFADRLGRHGVRLTEMVSDRPAHGLTGVKGMAYRTQAGLLLVGGVVNAADSPPWTPKAATVSGQGGESTEALGVVLTLTVENEVLAPGAQGRFAVELAPPATAAGGADYMLELHGDGGRVLTFKGTIPPAPE